MSSSLPPSLSGYGITLVSPPPQKFDSDIAALLSNEEAMTHLSFMTKINSGGWSIEDASIRRLNSEKKYSKGEGFDCIILRKNPISHQSGLFRCFDSDEEEDEVFSGICGFREINNWNRSAEMGIILHPDCFRQKISCKAHLLCLKFGFENLNLNRIEFKTSATNIGMINFCKDILGAVHEGTLRDFFPLPTPNSQAINGYVSVEIYSLLQSEWPIVKEKLLSKILQ